MSNTEESKIKTEGSNTAMLQEPVQLPDVIREALESTGVVELEVEVGRGRSDLFEVTFRTADRKVIFLDPTSERVEDWAYDIYVNINVGDGGYRTCGEIYTYDLKDGSIKHQLWYDTTICNAPTFIPMTTHQKT